MSLLINNILYCLETTVSKYFSSHFSVFFSSFFSYPNVELIFPPAHLTQLLLFTNPDVISLQDTFRGCSRPTLPLWSSYTIQLFDQLPLSSIAMEKPVDGNQAPVTIRLIMQGKVSTEKLFLPFKVISWSFLLDLLHGELLFPH